MEALLNVPNLLNALMVVVVWSIRQELGHIRIDIDEARKSANEAHKRIDGVLAK